MRKFFFRKQLACVLLGISTVLSSFGTADAAGNSITIMGSTALQPLVEQAANQYMEKKPGNRIMVQGGGSGTGLARVAQGGADIGNSDIDAEDKSGITAKALVDHKVAVVGIAVVVKKDITIKNLTQKQLIDIFTGKITNWKKVGGPDRKIVIINRPRSSGTRATFKKYALNGKEEAAGMSLMEDSSGTVRKTIAETPGAIGYLVLPYIDSSVKTVKLNGSAPSPANIKAGKYPIWAYEHMYTKGEPKGLAKDFLRYMVSKEVQEGLVPTLGYIPVSDIKRGGRVAVEYHKAGTDRESSN